MPARENRRGKHLGLGVTSAVLTASALLFAYACSDSQPGSRERSTIGVSVETIDPLVELARAVSAEDIAGAARVLRMEGVLQKRETLIDVLDRLGADRGDSNGAVYAASTFIDMRRLRPGETVAAFFEPLSEAIESAAGQSGLMKLSGLSFKPDAERQVLVSRSASGDWVSRELYVKAEPGFEKVGGEISTSIYEAALSQGGTVRQVVDFADILAYDVDFQREIRPGDRFEIAYKASFDERGDRVSTGDVLYAAIDGAKVKRALYRFTTPDDGQTDYYDASGEGARKFLMKTPINGARLSSSFGKRKHPVLGYTKMHKGTDFAAPRGTPVYAAGNGVVKRANRYGSFGNYVRIKHANGYETAYAHLNGFARGVRSGAKVKQGDIIGYVGTTGRSTGPHLHYEVLVKGSQVDAMRLDLPTGRRLDGDMLAAFKTERDRIDAIRGDLTAPILASAEQPADPPETTFN